MKPHGLTSRLLMSSVCGALLIAAPLALGQNARENTERQVNRTNSADSTSAGCRIDDAQMAQCVLIDNNVEVALSEYVHSKAQNPKVKEFAQQMVTDHNKLIQDLNKFAGNRASELAIEADATPAEKSRNRTEGADRPRTTARNEAQSSEKDPAARTHAVDLITLRHELGRQCLTSARQELDSKSGAEFDKCYIGMQLGAHTAMVDHLKVLRNHASPELSKVLAAGIQTAQTHRDHAKELMKELDAPNQRQAAN